MGATGGVMISFLDQQTFTINYSAVAVEYTDCISAGG